MNVLKITFRISRPDDFGRPFVYSFISQTFILIYLVFSRPGRLVQHVVRASSERKSVRSVRFAFERFEIPLSEHGP